MFEVLIINHKLSVYQIHGLYFYTLLTGCEFHVLLAYRRFPYIDANSDPDMNGPRNHLRIPGDFTSPLSSIVVVY